GLATMAALRRRGERVRMVNRSGSAQVPDDVEVVGGDARDAEFSAVAARGARVVYQALNPGYDRWAEQFPRLQAAVLATAQAAGARLVSLENVYMYGQPDGKPFTEASPYRAQTRKGRIRAAMARDLLAAHEAGRVAVVIARASDYFGPGGGAQSNLGDRVFPAVLQGKAARVLGDPNQPHTYTFIPDMGEGLATLGEHPDVPGGVAASCNAAAARYDTGPRPVIHHADDTGRGLLYWADGGALESVTADRQSPLRNTEQYFPACFRRVPHPSSHRDTGLRPWRFRRGRLVIYP